MKKVMNSKALLSVISLVLIAAMALGLAGCSNNKPKANADGTEKSFVFTVVYADGDGTSFDITTTASTVGEALLDEGLIEGEKGQYGLMVTKVTDVEYVYEKDGYYWAFHINGEYAMSGVDTTEITDGATYSFVATKAE